MPSKPRVWRPPGYEAAKRRKESSRDDDRKFYHSKGWRYTREERLTIDPCCVMCKAEGKTVLATHVDHIKPRHEYPELELDLDNTRSLCLAHHNTVTFTKH